MITNPLVADVVVMLTAVIFFLAGISNSYLMRKKSSWSIAIMLVMIGLPFLTECKMNFIYALFLFGMVVQTLFSKFK